MLLNRVQLSGVVLRQDFELTIDETKARKSLTFRLNLGVIYLKI